MEGQDLLGMLQLAKRDDGPAVAPISPALELGAYEALWLQQGASFKSLAERFARDPAALPSDLVPHDVATATAEQVLEHLSRRNVGRFGIRINHAADYPEKLRHARHPVEMLYYQGVWELTETRCVSIVGSRAASPEGRRRAQQIARDLVANDFTIVSGLATGIDASAHLAAMHHGGRTIAVIGTPLGDYYPRENRPLQDEIARNHLLISQVPVLRYALQSIVHNRLFFPERNVTMSALTEATIIVEASDTSGTLTQARAALHQGRKLFILDSCFQRTDISWPERFAKQGAVRVRTMDDIWAHLE
jgi:DNA processing protein